MGGEDNDAMSVATRLQCARQFFLSLMPKLGQPTPLVEDLVDKPEAKAMLHDLSIAVRSPEGVWVHGLIHTMDEPLEGYAAGSVQLRHMGRVVCTLHASSMT